MAVFVGIPQGPTTMDSLTGPHCVVWQLNVACPRYPSFSSFRGDEEKAVAASLNLELIRLFPDF